MISYGRQNVTQTDIDAVVEVLCSDFLTQGPAVPRFEKAVAGRVGAAYAVATTNATSALHLACMALQLGPGDLLWTVPNTFVASANCGSILRGGCGFRRYRSSHMEHERRVTEGETGGGKRTRKTAKGGGAGSILPDNPPNRMRFGSLRGSLISKFWRMRRMPSGHRGVACRWASCRWSDITVFSFHPVKIITTGEGGMALTNDPELAQRMETACAVMG